LAANGNSNSPLFYSFTDDNASETPTQYRLAQWDKDGKKTMSEIRIVKGTKSNGNINVAIWPSPNNGHFSLQVKEGAGTNYLLHINSLDGKRILSRNIAGSGVEQIHISTAGIYIVELTQPGAGTLYTNKVVVQ